MGLQTIFRLAPVGLVFLLVAASAGDPPARGTAVGDLAPVYAATTLEGASFSMGALRDQPVLIYVWATGCEACREELSALQTLHDRYAGLGLRVVAVSVDESRADGAVRRILEEQGLTLTVVRDPAERVTRAFRTSGVPEAVLVDRDGRIAARWVGRLDPTSAGVDAVVRKAVGR